MIFVLVAAVGLVITVLVAGWVAVTVDGRRTARLRRRLLRPASAHLLTYTPQTQDRWLEALERRNGRLP